MAIKFINTTSNDIFICGQTIPASGEYILLSSEFDSFYPKAVSYIGAGTLVVNVDGSNISSSQLYVESAIKKAILFGASLVSSYAAENVLLGITQAGMTSTVRLRMAGVLSALQTGSLYDVLVEIRSIPAEHKDATYITDARLLSFLNKVEIYLGLTPSTVL